MVVPTVLWVNVEFESGHSSGGRRMLVGAPTVVSKTTNPVMSAPSRVLPVIDAAIAPQPPAMGAVFAFM